MAFEEQLEKYQKIEIKKRLAIAAVLGCLYPVYIYVEQSDVMDQKIGEAQATREAARAKFEETDSKAKSLPGSIAQLKVLKSNLEDTKKKVSEPVDIDEILRRVATAGRDSETTLDVFTPKEPVETGTRVRYVKQEVDLKFTGKFSQVTRFLDQLLNLGPLTYVTDITYLSANKGGSNFQNAFDYRERLIINATAKLFVFKKVEVTQ
jgi:Tfp pilus assembly protein PilO